MELRRADINLGELLKAIYNVSDLEDRQLIKENNLYVVADLNGYGLNGIWLVCIETGTRFHSNARYFKKTDKN